MCPQFLSAKCQDSTRCPVGEEMAGFSYVRALRAMATMALQLGTRASSETVVHYRTLAAAATSGFHARFWNATSQSYGSDLSGQQMLLVPALTIAAMPDPAVRARVVQLLRTDLFNRSGHHLQIGAATSKSFLSVLSSYGLHASALRVVRVTTSPCMTLVRMICNNRLKKEIFCVTGEPAHGARMGLLAGARCYDVLGKVAWRHQSEPHLLVSCHALACSVRDLARSLHWFRRDTVFGFQFVR
jgi:hypothetical protein